MPDLSSLSPPSAKPVSKGAVEETRLVSSGVGKGEDIVPLWRCGVVLLMAAVICLAYWIYPPVFVPGRPGVVMELPTQVANYHGLKAALTYAETEGLPKDTEFARKEYFNSASDDVLCTIVLSGAGQNSIHRPEACLAGQGWNIVGQENVPVELLSGHKLIIRNLTLERDEGTGNDRRTLRRFYMYWFVGDNVTTPSHFTRVFLSSWDRIVNNRAHRWAFVIATSAIPDKGTPGDAAAGTKAMMINFIRQIAPTFQVSEMAAGAPAK